LIGKRYTILISLVFFLAFCIWSAEAVTFDHLLVSRIIGGLAAGLIEAIGPGIVIETFPESQLARAMVVYICLLAGGSSVGPILSGIVANGLDSWRWFYRILSIAIFLNLVCSIAMLPETTHEDSEPNQTLPARPSDGDASDKPSCTGVETQVAIPGDGAPSPTCTTTPNVSLRQQWMIRSFSFRYVQMDWKMALRNFYHPYQLIVLPHVLVTTLIFGLTIGWTVLVSIIVSIQYAQPPILWGSLKVGLLAVGPLVGLLIGLPVGGMLADFLFNRAARRGNDIPNPRSRLPATLVGALVSPCGCILLGYALRNPSDWAPVTVGWAMLSIGLTSSANVLLTYAVDTVPSRASHIGTVVNLTKNCLAFGVSYTSVSWTEAMGTVGQFGLMAGVLWLAYLPVILVWIYSDKLVRMSARLFGQSRSGMM
jgi:MFS family permease